jgi:hypothetical protein
MTEASVSFADDLTDNPSSSASSPGPCFGWVCGRREPEASF